MNVLSIMRTFSFLWATLLVTALGAGSAAAQSGMIPFGEGFGRTVVLEGDALFVGEPFSDISPGQVFVLQRDASGSWVEQDRLIPGDGAAEDRFGEALAASDGRVLVGATLHDEYRGAAYVFERDAGGVWIEAARLTAGDAAPNDRFGGAVAIDGDRALVGAFFADGGAGAAYVFERDAGGVWTQVTRLAAGDAVAGDRFGSAVAVQGDRAFVAAPYKDERRGSVYVFEREESGEWVERQVLAAGDAVQGMRFGQALAVQGETGIVGAPVAESGAAYVFRFDPAKGSWSMQQKLLPADAEPSAWFGWEVVLHGNRALVSAILADGGTGAAYVFAQDEGASWTERARLSPSVIQGIQFGRAVALGEEAAFVGTSAEEFGAGAAYVFEQDAGGGWPEAARLIGSDVALPSMTGGRTACTGGAAGPFACQGVDLLAFLATRDAGGVRGIGVNDLWGWTDPETGTPYALLGREDGVSFVDLSDPERPRYLGDLPRTEGSFVSSWRDVKVYQNYALVVSDNAGPQGVQVFDLTQLRAVTDPPVAFQETARYTGLREAHNIAVNEATGFAYAVGSETCGGGLHMIDLADPLRPDFAGCFTSSLGRGYTHDVQCVVYHGPDPGYQGREICIGANESGIGIADVTDKAAPVEVAAATYPDASYVHQGWLSEDHRYFFQNDELDELNLPTVSNTRTMIWDLADLDDPLLMAPYVGPTTSIDHNLYVRGGLLFASNYTSGLRILDIRDVSNPVEAAFFDTVPGTDAPTFGGSWSNYPFFDGGFVVLTSREFGLFVVEPTAVGVATEAEGVPEAFRLAPAYPNPFAGATTLTLALPAAGHLAVTVYDVVGRRVAVLHEGWTAPGVLSLPFEAGGLPAGAYLVRAVAGGAVRTRLLTLVR